MSNEQRKTDYGLKIHYLELPVIYWKLNFIYFSKIKSQQQQLIEVLLLIVIGYRHTIKISTIIDYDYHY